MEPVSEDEVAEGQGSRCKRMIEPVPTSMVSAACRFNLRRPWALMSVLNSSGTQFCHRSGFS